MNNSALHVSRRTLLRASAAAVLAAPLGIGVMAATAPRASAAPSILGTVIDYAGGVPRASEVKAAGHMGAIRYVTPRPDASNWAKGKPVTLTETLDYASQGLSVASVYQHGAADWSKGAAGVITHAPQAIAYHVAAGGPRQRPIYIAIDANPTREQYVESIRPFLLAFSQTLTATGYQTGVYGNYRTIEWAIADGIGEFFWQHDWGPKADVHPRAHVHQKSGMQSHIDGVLVDINSVYASDWGQWVPGALDVPTLPDPAESTDESASDPAGTDATAGDSAPSAPSTRQTVTIGGITVPVPTQEQINRAVALARQLS